MQFSKKSFRIIKLRFLETTETAIACTGWIGLINDAIASGSALGMSEISFCDRLQQCTPRNRLKRGFAHRAISRRRDVERIAVCPFYISKIAADSANHYPILLAYLPAILKQNLDITKLIQSIETITTQKTTFFNVTNVSTDLLNFQAIDKLYRILARLYLIDIILAFYRPIFFI